VTKRPAIPANCAGRSLGRTNGDAGRGGGDHLFSSFGSGFGLCATGANLRGIEELDGLAALVDPVVDALGDAGDDRPEERKPRYWFTPAFANALDRGCRGTGNDGERFVGLNDETGAPGESGGAGRGEGSCGSRETGVALIRSTTASTAARNVGPTRDPRSRTCLVRRSTRCGRVG
jgi:hypothetical protein